MSRCSSRIGATIFSAPMFSFSRCVGSASTQSVTVSYRFGPGALRATSFNTCCCGSSGCGCERWWAWDGSFGAHRRFSFSAMGTMSCLPASSRVHRPVQGYRKCAWKRSRRVGCGGLVFGCASRYAFRTSWADAVAAARINAWESGGARRENVVGVWESAGAFPRIGSGPNTWSKPRSAVQSANGRV